MAMLRPSYNDLMNVVNGQVEEGEQPVINSRYSIVLATAKRARQIIAGDGAEEVTASRKPLSIAVEELDEGIVRIIGDDETEAEEEAAAPLEEAVADAAETESAVYEEEVSSEAPADAAEDGESEA